MTVDAGVITWDGYDAAAIGRRCRVPRVELLAETDSTLDVAHALAEAGAPAGTLVVADSQRAGRGRQGRAWTSRPGAGVWATVIERPSDPSILDLLSVRVGLRLAEGLDALAGEEVDVKWPNDLFIRAGKLGGILTEARWSGTTLGWVAVGVGVNVTPPPDVTGAAGLHRGERLDVLEAIVNAVRAGAAATGELTADERARYAARDALAGRRIVAPATGRVAGISATGSLLVDTERGREQHRTGTIRFAEGGGGAS